MKQNLARSLVLSLSAAFLASFGVPAAAADVYDLDGGHSYALFKINHLGFGNSWGRFNDISGTLTIDEESPAASSVAVEIKTESIDTNLEDRDKHLRSPDFFNAAEFPVISFKSTSVKKSGERAYQVSGEFTMHGVTKPLTVTLERIGTGSDPWGNTRTGFDATFVIKRSEFGMSYMPKGLGDEVTVVLAVEGVKKK